jgi:hypothetical protein
VSRGQSAKASSTMGPGPRLARPRPRDPKTRAQGCLDSHPNGVVTADPFRGLPGSMQAAKRIRWRLRDHHSRRSSAGGARCLRGRGAHRGRRHDGAAPFGQRPGGPVGDPSAGPGPEPRRYSGAPNAGNTDVSLPTGGSDRPVAISSWGPIVPTQPWSSNLRPRRSTLGCGPSSGVSVMLWAAPAGTAARGEGPARTSQKTTHAGWSGDLTPHRLPAVLRFSHCPNP